MTFGGRGVAVWEEGELVVDVGRCYGSRREALVPGAARIACGMRRGRVVPYAWDITEFGVLLVDVWARREWRRSEGGFAYGRRGQRDGRCGWRSLDAAISCVVPLFSSQADSSLSPILTPPLPQVENFPGFPDGIGGSEMMDKFRAQSERFGTTIITETVSKLDLSARPFKYWREGEEDDPRAFETADTIIMATGASAKRMNLPGEETYWQSGISACAVCDGAVPIFRNKPLAVIGGGDSAAEEATYLTKYASHVYVLVRRGELRASKIMAKRLVNHPKVTVLWHVSTHTLDLLGSSLTLRRRRPSPRNARATATSSNP
jgi:thioredoxin reductase